MNAFRLIRRGRRTLRRLYTGPLAAYIDRIAAWYDEQGYERTYAVAALRAVDVFGRWLLRADRKVSEIDEDLIDHYILERLNRLHPCTRVALGRLLVALREGGVATTPVIIRGRTEIIEEDFQQYLIKECGLAERTIEHYSQAAHMFLAALFRQGRRDPSKWTAADVLTFIRQHARVRRPAHLQSLCTGLRSFFRYLRFRGKTSRDLASSVPRIARWRLATLPKALSPEQLGRVLAHCDRYSILGRRNYAILLLLARLGLRAHEVRSLTLDDIDWRSGHIMIRSKNRELEQLPLPVDVGKALAAYLAHGRPPSTSRAVFVRATPPHVEFRNSGAITTIAAKTIRAAAADAPARGAHVFRHTLATQMLRQGASLRQIGQLLRHRDEDTTRIYAKVDLTRLRTLTSPWPGGAS
jgi:site-specific recombinase XerD